MPKYCFPPFEFDPDTGLLCRDGAPLSLRDKTAKLLEYFLAERHRRLSNTELLDQVWPDTHVTEAVLFQTISELRKVLGPLPNGREFISNQPRRGYQWVYQPTFIEGETPESESLADTQPPSTPIPETKRSKSRTRLIWVIGLILIAIVASLITFLLPKHREQKIASLIILEESGLIEGQYRQEERVLGDLLFNALGDAKLIQLYDPDTAREWLPGLAKDLGSRSALAQRLHESYEASHVVFLKLDGAGSVWTLWFSLYQGKDLVVVERHSDVHPFSTASWVAKRLAELSGHQDPQPIENFFTADPEAFRQYGEALMALNAGDLSACRKLMRAAVEKDPEFVYARVWVAGDMLRAGDTATARLELEQLLPKTEHLPALYSYSTTKLGQLYWQQMDYLKARDLFRNAIQWTQTTNEPGEECDFRQGLGASLAYLGEHEAALVELEKARQLAMNGNVHLTITSANLYLAGAYARTDSTQKSKQLFEETLKSLEARGNQWYISYALSHYVDALIHINDPSALALNTRHQKLCREIGDQKQLANALAQHAHLLQQQQAWQPSLDALNEAYPIAAKNHNKALVAQILLLGLRANLHLGNQNEVERYLVRAQSEFGPQSWVHQSLEGFVACFKGDADGTLKIEQARQQRGFEHGLDFDDMLDSCIGKG